MSRTARALVLPAIALALAIAGCSGGSGGGTASTEAGSGATSITGSEPGPGAFVSLASVPKLGLVLVDSKGFTLYDFRKDQGTRSSCYGACAKAWPPLLTEGPPQPSNGTSAAKLGTTRRSDGAVQVTYAGHPLYGYAGDRKPGEANGNDFSSYGGQWYALKGSGKEAG